MFFCSYFAIFIIKTERKDYKTSFFLNLKLTLILLKVNMFNTHVKITTENVYHYIVINAIIQL